MISASRAGGWGRKLFVLAAAGLALLGWGAESRAGGKERRPNILLAISDDQSWPHAGAYGCAFVRTPGFDRVAREGVLFRNAHAASAGCSPSRAALLTGRHTWQLEQAGTHASSFPARYAVYPELLERAGYWVGYTGKPWGPGDWKAGGRDRNPAGPPFNGKKTDPPAAGINKVDYAANFRDFLKQRPAGRPFCFWFGATEPHRSFQKGIGLKSGKKLADVEVPPFLPDTELVRSDLLDYAFEVEWFDEHLRRMIQILEEAGELENTIVVVTSDNGMSFPRAKANLYEYGTHVPLAVRWGARVPGGRTVDDLVGFVDLAPTFLEAAGLQPPEGMSGRSLLPLLLSGKRGRVEPDRDRVFTARERHSSSRVDNLGYPCRAIRKGDYLYIRNFAPDRWPAGDPRGVGKDRFGYYDIDACPSKTFLVENREEYPKLFDLAVGKRPAEELFDVGKDPGCLVNLADDPDHADARRGLARELEAYLRETGDPRVTGNGDVWETYRRYSPIRKFR